MDWFRGTSTGKHGFSHQIGGVPVFFTETNPLTKLRIRKFMPFPPLPKKMRPWDSDQQFSHVQGELLRYQKMAKKNGANFAHDPIYIYTYYMYILMYMTLDNSCRDNNRDYIYKYIMSTYIVTITLIIKGTMDT